MRLLVTRPMDDALPLADQLAALGHDVLISPLLHIEVTSAPLPPPDSIGALAVTSANGARALAAQFSSAAEAAAWQALSAYAVGPQTALVLRGLGFGDTREAAGDIAALVGLISAQHKDGQKSNKPVLHIAGRDRAGDLAAALSAAQIPNARCVLYKAEAATSFTEAAAAALCDAQEPVEGVVLYSARSAQIFIDLYRALNPTLNSALPTAAAMPRPRAYCLSAALAEKLEAAGFEAVAAAAPTPEAMLALCAAMPR